MLKKLSLAALVLLSLPALAQKQVVDPAEALRIETYLASDALAGRKPGTPGIKLAADFIADEFRKAGLQPLPGASGYLQEFSMFRPKLTELKVKMAGQDFDAANVIVITTKTELKVNEKSGLAVKRITADDLAGGTPLIRLAQKIVTGREPAIVLVDNSGAPQFSKLMGLKRTLFTNTPDVVFLLAAELPAEYTIKATHTVDEMKLANVVGMLPGNSRKDEQVVFSGHYDHLGVSVPMGGDSIYNGANDDASGITSMILLAQHFARQKNNARTLLFSAFTAEESGGFGATYFSRQLDPEKVVAMFNIEMVGTPSKWGHNSAYITGFEKSSMGAILQDALKGSSFNFYPDPYPEQKLFYRSDNATLARLGVPAHTISTSQMDVEPHYHRPSDEVGTLDMNNLARITEAIAVSAATIVSGKETPTRVKE